jgi:hypothetical protein
VANPQHGTLVATTVSTFTLDGDYDQVEVLNVDGAARVTFTVNGSTPTVDGNGGYLLPATICSRKVAVRTAGNTVVKVISSGTPMVSVVGI